MNFGSLSHHSDDKVISNIRERIQKQQRLRNQNNYNITNTKDTNELQKHRALYSKTNDYLDKLTESDSLKSLNIKKTVRHHDTEQNRPVLTELTNTNANNNGTRGLRNNKNLEAASYQYENVYLNQENFSKNQIPTSEKHNTTYNNSDMDVDSNNDSVVLSNQRKSSGKRVISSDSVETTTSNTSTLSRKEVEHLKLEETFEDEVILKEAYKEHHVSFPDMEDPDTFDVTLCPEYQPEIFKHLRDLEEKCTPIDNFILYQPSLTWKHRHIVLNWLINAHDRLKLLPETLYLSVNIFDRLLSTVEVTKEKLHLVAATSLFIASKYEEIDHVLTKDLKTLLNSEYNDQHIYLSETFILQSLNFDIGYPGPMSFLRKLSKADNYQYDKRTLAKYLLETTIVDPKLATCKPSWLAAGAYYLSMVILENLEDYNKYKSEENSQETNADLENSNENYTIWTSSHVYYSGYTERQLTTVASTIAQNCRNWDRSHEAIYQKYCSKRQKRCALIVDDWLKILEEQRTQEDDI